MEPLHTWKDYLKYKTLLNHVNALISYYEKYKEDVHNNIPEVQTAKRELLKTKYKTLNGPDRTKISIENATNQQVNMAFKKAFSKKDKEMPEYLKIITKPWYETRIRNYETKLRSMLPSAVPLEQAIAAEQLALREHNHTRADKLHSTIEERLEACSQEELKQIWDAYKPHINILLQYSAFKKQIR